MNEYSREVKDYHPDQTFGLEERVQVSCQTRRATIRFIYLQVEVTDISQNSAIVMRF